MRAIAILAVGTILTFTACETEPETELEETAPTPAAGEEMGRADEMMEDEHTVDALGLDSLEAAGAYLTAADGRAVYLFTADSEGSSSCYDACAEAWPPVLTSGPAPTAHAQDIDASLIGTIQRRDGRTQVTYGGHPLYFYVEDQGPGSATGQDVHGFDGEWYLVTPEGTELHSDEEGEMDGEMG